LLELQDRQQGIGASGINQQSANRKGKGRIWKLRQVLREFRQFLQRLVKRAAEGLQSGADLGRRGKRVGEILGGGSEQVKEQDTLN